MERKCLNCANCEYRDDGERLVTDTCVKCVWVKVDGDKVPSNWQAKPMTNGEEIRATDDELATMLHAVKLGYAPWCDYHCENEGEDGCDNCIKKWLQQPAEGE